MKLKSALAAIAAVLLLFVGLPANAASTKAIKVADKNLPSFSSETLTLSEMQETALLSQIQKQPDADQIVCIGMHVKDAIDEELEIAELRALAVCSYAQEVLPEIKTKTQLLRVTSKKLNTQVKIRLYENEVQHKPNKTERGFETARSLFDQEDAIKGMQLKPIYLVPRGEKDEYLDLNGTIAEVLDAGNAYVKKQVGRKFVIDKKKDGSYDIGFIKSDFTAEEIYEYFYDNDLDMQDFLAGTAFDNITQNRKLHVLFVAAPGDGTFCGYAELPGTVSVSFTQSDYCTGESNGFDNWVTRTWVHEVLHNLGVDHVAEPCDLMASTYDYPDADCGWEDPNTMDKSKVHYRGSDEAGVDIMKSGIWEKKNTLKSTHSADCHPTSWDDYFEMVCEMGKVTIGPRQWCWGDLEGMELQVLKNGKWVRAAKGKAADFPWKDKDLWYCYDDGYQAPTATLKLKPGNYWYRWKVNGEYELPFLLRVQA